MHWSYCKTTEFSDEDMRCAYGRLSPSRKARIDRLHHREDRERSLAAELLVYRLLKEYWNVTSAELQSRENGAPYLSGCHLHVSISHCGDVVACAVSEEPVGIDAQCMRPMDMNICHRVCTKEELAYVSGNSPLPTGTPCEDPEVLRRFFEIWTAKEAYFKKCGTGITNLKSVNILPLQREMHVLDNCVIQIL